MESCWKPIDMCLKLVLKIYGERWIHATRRRGKANTFEKTLDARISELENRLSSRFLAGVSTSYNSEHMYDIPSDFNIPKFPVQQYWPMKNTYNSLGAIDPGFTSVSQYVDLTSLTSSVQLEAPIRPTVIVAPVQPNASASPTKGHHRSDRSQLQHRPFIVIL
uniref:Uncharacterized protein n=1 Tax=Oryza punctata TaxID=4537 RepID=A0A0E0MNA8_ORYPU